MAGGLRSSRRDGSLQHGLLHLRTLHALHDERWLRLCLTGAPGLERGRPRHADAAICRRNRSRDSYWTRRTNRIRI